MTINRLQLLHDAGQSLWLDYIDRRMLQDGTLERRIREDVLTGMTSNPTIFQKALAEGAAYDAQLASAPRNLAPWQLFELVETQDVRDACDAFAGVYKGTNGQDGFVSIEVSPGVSSDPAATLEEARRLWEMVDRPNLMVKVPGTVEGAEAVRQLISEGINVNITLLFAIEAYDRVIDAYLAGLEARAAVGGSLDGIASVASFFVSRVDTEVDRLLQAIAAGSTRPDQERLAMLKGKAAIANAKLAYRLFQRRFSGARWEALAARGAALQRPLWASTSTKNPAYRDVMYVEELIGPNTVNTLPPATLEAFRDHGEVDRTVDRDTEESERVFRELAQVGVSMGDVTDTLLAEGIASFQKSFDDLISGIESKMGMLATR
jgi:transaldolase